MKVLLKRFSASCIAIRYDEIMAHCTKFWKHFTQVVIIVVFIVTDVFTKVNTDDWQKAFMGFTLFTVIIFNVMVAIFQVDQSYICPPLPPPVGICKTF